MFTNCAGHGAAVQLSPGNSVSTIDLAPSFVARLVAHEGRNREHPARSMMRKLLPKAVTHQLIWKSGAVASEDRRREMASSGIHRRWMIKAQPWEYPGSAPSIESLDPFRRTAVTMAMMYLEMYCGQHPTRGQVSQEMVTYEPYLDHRGPLRGRHPARVR